MKKALNYFVCAMMAMLILVIPNAKVYAADVSLGVSASTVNIGDSVTATITIPENVTGTVDLSFSKDVLAYSSASVEVGVNSGVITINIGKLSMAGSNKVTVTFKATSAGTANLKASVVAAYDNDTLEDVTLGGASTKVTVQNETVSEPEETKSSDCYLAKLKLSNGSKNIKLSPDFNYRKTSYTATVDYDVKSVVVSATRSSGKAEITSITDNGNVNLKVGENVIEIVVKAENGKTLTYKITVTRKEKAAESQNPSESQTPNTSEKPTEEPTTADFEINGNKLYVSSDIPSAIVPTDFTEKTVVINGSKEVTGLSFKNGDCIVLYLENENKVGNLYVYDEENNYVYPFIKLMGETSYVMVLMPDDTTVPEGYAACTLSIEAKGIVNAYQYQSTEGALDFYLLYCMNNQGKEAWYQYDVVDGTYQRYAGIIPSVPTQNDTEGTEGTENTEDSEDTPVIAPEDNDMKEAYEKLEAELQAAKELQRLVICIAVFVGAVLVIVIINLVLAKSRGNSDYEEDDEDDDDEYEDFDEKQVFKPIRPVEKQKEVSEEIDVEQIPEVTVDDVEEKTEVPQKNDQTDDQDDEELEFIDL